jgi:hypothetical protein
MTAEVMTVDIFDMLFYYPFCEKPTLDICMEGDVPLLLFYSKLNRFPEFS